MSKGLHAEAERLRARVEELEAALQPALSLLHDLRMCTTKNEVWALVSWEDVRVKEVFDKLNTLIKPEPEEKE